MKSILISTLLTLVISLTAIGQYHYTTSFEVQGNKTVVVELVTTGINAPSNCEWGYTFNVNFDYSIKCYNKGGNEVGFNDIYTLQGVFKCDDKRSSFGLPNNTAQGSGVSANMSTTQTNCSTATVEDFLCNIIEFEFEAKGYNGNRFTEVIGNSTLPIELINFDAKTNNQQVDLNWSTASELNNDYFTIERSADGMNWETIQTVEGAGNSSRVLNYTWTDYSPYAGISYYRLTQTDFDGASETFDIISVENKNVTELKAYPNPATSMSNITGLVQNQDLRIFNTMGVEVTRKVNISFIGDEKAAMNISQLPKGMYYIRNGVKSIQFVKN